MITRPALLILLLASLLASTGCQQLDPHLPDENMQVQLPQWLALESEFHCYPVDEYSLSDGNLEPHFPLSPDDVIWPRLQAGLTLDYVDHPAVKAQLDWYRRHPQYLERVQQRASRYLFHVLEMLHENDVPYDFALLPIIESAYEPFAYSHGRAAGLWQFIPVSGQRFGLNQNWWLDERRDVVESTRAAIAYLKFLHRFFDQDWQLALAAYNAGEGTVRNAIRRNQRQQRPADFWHLELPAETRAYVPKLIALAEIFRHPEKYDIALLPISNRPYFTSVTLDGQLDLLQAAEMANISIEELYYLNPGLNRWATPPVNNYPLKIPLSAQLEFSSQIATLPDQQRITWQRHTIRPGESLNSIAGRYQTDKDWIREANQLTSDVIIAGKVLMVPIASAEHHRYRLSEAERVNRRQGNAPAQGMTRHEHIVKSGDSFWKIARQYDVDIKALARWNSKAPGDMLRAGDKLVVWLAADKSSAFRPRDDKIARINYRVRNGDSLAKIAGKFNVAIGQIVNWNNINPDKYLQPGQPLTLYVNVMNTSH